LNTRDKRQQVSFVLRVMRGPTDGEFNGEIAMADGRRLNLADGMYKVQAWMSPDGGVTRGQVTRIPTNESVYFQTGDRIAKFVRSIICGPDFTQGSS
jgi:hypothetical protein